MRSSRVGRRLLSIVSIDGRSSWCRTLGSPLVISAVTILAFAIPISRAADVPTQDACVASVAKAMVAKRDEYRSFVFGSRRTEDGENAVLTGGTAREERAGILETKGRTTSELVEPLIAAYRAYRCRTLSVCEAMRLSILGGTGPAEVRLLGCEERTLPRFAECALTATASDGIANASFDPVRMAGACRQLAEETLRAERAALRLAVAYDAGYRSMLQFAGMMDWMQEALPSQVLRAVADMVGLLGKLHQIPCFVGQCDLPAP